MLFHCTARQYMHCHTEQRECDADTLRRKERFFDHQLRRRMSQFVHAFLVLKSRRNCGQILRIGGTLGGTEIT